MLCRRKWRGRSPKNVADEVHALQKARGVKHFIFMDPNLTTDPARVRAIAEEFIRRDLGIRFSFPYGVRA